MNEPTLVIDDLAFVIHYSPQRQSLGLTVERDGSLVLTAPDACSWGQIEQFARQKQMWVYTKLAEKETLGGPGPRLREYVNGEGFYYLGRSYQLRLVSPEQQSVPLRLWQGYFCLRKDGVDAAADHFRHWYIEHGRPWLTRRVDLYANRVGAQPKEIAVGELGYRWGSCSPGQRLHFHWRTVCLPVRIIEYVVVHELVHLVEPHHGLTFWERVRRVMPDYEERGRWLAEDGHAF